VTNSHPQHRALAAILAASAALLLPACGSGNNDRAETAGDPGSQTLAAMVAADDDLSFVSETLGNAGMADVFDGTAAYTILAPTDSAFEALGEAGEELRSPEQRAAMIAILRDHIVPGYLTTDDIARAIELADDRQVEMQTMGARTLTFTSEGERVVVTAEDGARAHMSGETLRASNGVAIPLDGVLKRIGQPQA
jgi:uncharacterized surface protein with fasciclin (FAS1) repeats